MNLILHGTQKQCYLVETGFFWKSISFTAGESNECWRGCGKIGTLMHCWRSCELIQPFWMAIWNYAQRALKDCLPFDLAISIGKCGYALQLGNGWTSCGIWWWCTIVLKGIKKWRNSVWTGMTSRNWCRVKGDEPEEHCTQRLIQCGTIECNGLVC